ncbi:hypothetical protein [Afipia broomeae]|nr:hypothetical protein [Afipia broomeae]
MADAVDGDVAPTSGEARQAAGIATPPMATRTAEMSFMGTSRAVQE